MSSYELSSLSLPSAANAKFTRERSTWDPAMEDLARATQHLPEIHTIVKALRHKDAEGVDQDTLHPFSEENYIKKVTEQEEEAGRV